MTNVNVQRCKGTKEQRRRKDERLKKIATDAQIKKRKSSHELHELTRI